MAYFKVEAGGGTVHIVEISGVSTFNCSSYPGYKNFTVANNFIQGYSEVSGSARITEAADVSVKYTRSLSYNSSTGVLTISGGKTGGTNGEGSTLSISGLPPVYLVYAD